jgi:probable phosphoglycerate mutase
MTKILLVRHGETDWNKEHRLQGYIDIPLNQEGILQAELLGQALEKEPIDIVYSSDLSRAFDTANAIAKRHSLPIFVDKQLRERNYGEIQGMTYREIEEKLPENHHAWHSRDPHFQPRGGETLHEFNERVTNCIQHIANQHPDQIILIVAHGGVLDCMYRHATQMGLAEKRKVELLNTSLNRLQFDGKNFQIHSWGDVSHLRNKNAKDDVDSGPASVPWVLP